MVATRAGGNPFFAEEMARILAEEGTRAAELPDTVQALLAARLDSLEPHERQLAAAGRRSSAARSGRARSRGRARGRAT